jgi:glycerol-3-phosphate dehydrogenase (NAD(P)+)
MTTSFVILGDGAWGTAIALLLAQNPQHRVTLWSAREESGRLLRQHRENVRLLPGIRIPESITLTTDVAAAVQGADLWVAAVPTIYLRTTLENIRGQIQPGPPIVSLAKGLENSTFRRPSEILTEVLGVEPVLVLSGPSHAEEVSRGQPTSVVVAGRDMQLIRWVQQCFSTDRFRVYTNLDPIGVELGGALKNVIGIAAGISVGLGFGDNTRAALMTRGLVEMTRFGVANGAEPQTFMGLAGMGDLITTCVSRHGRNRHVGEQLGQGKKLPDVLGGMAMVAEGVYTTRSVRERARNMGIEMPITSEVYNVLYEDKDPLAAVNDLMLRRPKGEK